MTTPNGQHPSRHERWQPPFLTLPIHAVIEHQLRLGLNGVESTLMHGARGSGKSESMTRQIASLEAEQLQAELATGARAGRIIWYETSKATGPKTVLTDLFAILSHRPIGKRSRQDWTPTQFITQITERLVDENVRVVAIDEAHLIDAGNIDLLRQVPDVAGRHGHSLRLFLVGNEGLVRNVAATGQLGERFTGYVPFPPLTPAHVSPYLRQFHAGLGTIQEAEGPAKWGKLERALFSAARGSFRRLCTIIANAHELSLVRGETLAAVDLWHAINKLPPEGP